MKKLFISDLKIGDSIFGETFAVKSYVKKASRNNKPYIDIELSDASGTIKGKIWSDDFANCDVVVDGAVVTVNGMVDDFNGPQLKISNLRQTENFDVADLQQTSKFDIGDMWSDINKEISEIKNPHLQKILESIFTPDFVETFKNAPAGYIVHHAYAGGLIEHTWEMLRMTDSIKDHFPKINLDLVKTGVILHDCGKARELVPGTAIKQTDEGKLLGHIYLGAETVKMSAPKETPKDLLDELLHIILSHHGTKEFGSPVVPMTTEAIAVSALDMASTKMNLAYSHIHQVGGNEKYTPYVRHLETELYRSPYADELANEDIPF